ncbi:hypothetical protein [Ramlibacter pallidus]|uniref:DUF4402 domain-containing protein n=1 Tax=Ramlibacter pallidus TaxID=2780087 RepID=A0ABR9S7P5_9BURK|nr:hypothetical protein [Ramlibacter pallidus]MBE7369552.1 hypothetical protein [Ramlibacter pallidus]
MPSLEAFSRRAAAAGSAAIALSLACASVPAAAETASATLTIRVAVPAVTLLKLPAHHVDVELSAADVARGFATPDAPFTVEVLTNLRDGLQLELACATAPCEPGRVLAEDGSQAWHVPGGRGLRRHTVTAPLRLPISRGAAPGRYRVAVQVTTLGP